MPRAGRHTRHTPSFSSATTVSYVTRLPIDSFKWQKCTSGWAEERESRAQPNVTPTPRTCFAVQLEQRDVVVESLRVVVVMNVGGGHADGLGAGRAKLLREVVVADADVYCVTGSNDARITCTCV